MPLNKMRPAAAAFTAAAAITATIAGAQPASAARFAPGCTGLPQVAAKHVEDHHGDSVAALAVFKDGNRVCATAVSTTDKRVNLTVAVTVENKQHMSTTRTYRVKSRYGFARVAKALTYSRLKSVRMRAVTKHSHGSATYLDQPMPRDLPVRTPGTPTTYIR